jgi:hypothetical protein
MATSGYNHDDAGALARWSAVPVWAVSLAGFGYYVATFGSFADNYGTQWAAALSLLWLALFVMLHRTMPLRQPGARREAPDEGRAPTESPEPLTEMVARALTDDAAQDGVLSVMPPARDTSPGGVLTPLEQDLADWGYTYGVAWANARARYPDESDEVVAQRALAAAREVFAQYMGDANWSDGIARERQARA